MLHVFIDKTSQTIKANAKWLSKRTKISSILQHKRIHSMCLKKKIDFYKMIDYEIANEI